MELEFTESELPLVAKKIIATAASKTLCFYGAMGAGKTTLIKALVKELDGGTEANSPTFGLVNEYHTSEGELLGYHFDFYRIKDEAEAMDLGLEDYFHEDVWIFVEWPEKVANLLPQENTRIVIKELSPELRELKIEN